MRVGCAAVFGTRAIRAIKLRSDVRSTELVVRCVGEVLVRIDMVFCGKRILGGL